MAHFRDAFRSQSVLLFLVLSAGGVLALLVSNDPRAPWLFSAGLCGIAIGYFLFQRPLTTLYIALFLHLTPTGIRFDDRIFDPIVHLTTALALASWLSNTVAHRRPITWNMICVITALYMSWGIVSLLWAPDIVEGRKKLVAYAIGFLLIFLITNQIKSLRALDGLMRVLRLNAWIIVIGGIYAALLGNFTLGDRLKVLNMNENALGMVLLLMLPGVIWPVFRSEGVKRRLMLTVSIAYVLFTVVLVALSGSRGSTIAVVIVLVTFAFSRPTRPWGMIGVFIVIGAVLGAPFLEGGLSKRFMEGEGGNLGGRAELWDASRLLIYDHPLTGAGIGNGAALLPQYVQEVSNDPYKLGRATYPSHNPILEASTDTGLPGMSIYLCLYASAVIQFVRSRRRACAREKALLPYFHVMFGVALAFLIAAMKSGGLEAQPTLFLLLALLVIPAQFSYRTRVSETL
ncbi:O-antigen ligase family protein [Microvirga terrae]|uniref:O-antigen ligase family protein n=1 Tax=Microvirga terrae TaxID=2740529 RepID=A0ABY5RKV6_9HYPH|nr:MULTISPECIES: O-antigen ligase family protein [Microvirga]MBQ0819728.1 O-antigen ligase family protein [Microvirga sp. HBU67558]UVF17603.1 O-antigen ligase family protein [Microvirga terrae]